MEPTKKTSADQVGFEQLCAEVEEFEPLPAVTAEGLERGREDEDDTSLDGQILAGLVSPA